MDYIDLRSDTVTKPTNEMREAMKEAEVGDDVYQEDPTVNRLQALSAEKMGKEAGLFVPSGTMGNLIAVLTHCGRGEEVILGNLSHTFLFEAGGISALGGVHPYVLPNQNDGTIDLASIRNAIRSKDIHFPVSKLLVLENTHNRCGGVVLSRDYLQSASELAHSNGLLLHLDGARIFNAAAAIGIDARELTDSADSVTFCLSKSLCAPVGSVLCGSKEFIERAMRIRKQLGGGMRQAGILAAAGIVALEKMIDRLPEDHRKAQKLAWGLRNVPAIKVESESPATNMVFVQVEEMIGYDSTIVARCLEKQRIRVGIVGERRLRMVLHHDVDDNGVDAAIEAFRTIHKMI